MARAKRKQKPESEAGATVLDYPNLASYLAGLEACDLLFAPAHGIDALVEHSPLNTRIRIHRFAAVQCISINDLQLEDLAALRTLCESVLVRRISLQTLHAFAPKHILAHFANNNFRIFLPHGSPGGWMAYLRQYHSIGLSEFACSRPERLSAYPAVSVGLTYGGVGDCTPIPAVFILDLIQDFEILKPLLLRCVGPFSRFLTRVAVTDRVINSHIWNDVNKLFEALAIPWFNAASPLDAVSALGGGKSLLITASESTAPGHAFCHQTCRIAPAKAIKVTCQHGFECIGLRHHRAHDLQFPSGVRFASDFIFTWAHPDALPDLNPMERDKCIPVGVIKGMAEEAGTIDSFASSVGQDNVRSTRALELLVAENLHSVRFTAPVRYQRFLNFICSANDDGNFSLTVRSHPGKRTLEQQKDTNGFEFLEGLLHASDLAKFGFFVSPPSTIVLDAILAGVPTAVWSDAQVVGDCQNYAGVPAVCDLRDVEGICAEVGRLEKVVAQNYFWAAENVCAFNGIPQAWSRLLEVLGN
jgi:hypothetical protein